MSDVFAVSGGKNSGKTTFIEGLVKFFNKRGIKTAVIKHDGHKFEPDTKGTDSRRFFDSGAFGAAVFDNDKIQIVKRIECEIKPEEIFPEADIILLEGFKYSDYPKIWMCSEENFENIKNIILWAGKDGDMPNIEKNDVETAGEYILDIIRRRKYE